VLRTRIATAAVVLPAVLALVLFAPAPVFTAVVCAFGAVGLYEIGAMNEASGPAQIALLVGGGLAASLAVFYGQAYGAWLLSAAVLLATLVLVVRVAVRGGRKQTPSSGLILLGALYVVAFFPYFALLRNHGDGARLLIFTLLSVVASDSGAYFVGLSVGRRKLLPKVSPKKTVEGAIGGLVLCVLAAVLLRGLLLPRASLGAVGFAALVVGVLAQLGDLVGSALKRSAGVKDSGWLFPGHGGLLDRTSSLVFAVFFIYHNYLHNYLTPAAPGIAALF
jgi:phosphatidate cytidylyltransferase